MKENRARCWESSERLWGDPVHAERLCEVLVLTEDEGMWASLCALKGRETQDTASRRGLGPKRGGFFVGLFCSIWSVTIF